MSNPKYIEEIYRENKFSEIEKKYNIVFEDKELLIKAFTHGSFNKHSLENYQRLEFLGDAVLQMIVSDHMYRTQNEDSEGIMSKKRGALVSEFSLAYIMKKEKLEQYIMFGKSLKLKENVKSNSYIADVYESLIAAIYLDQGYQKANKFILRTLINIKDEILQQDFLQDYKTELQEKLQINGNIDIKYLTTEKYDENGKFESTIKLEGINIGLGIGKTKKQAEQQAAKNALRNMV